MVDKSHPVFPPCHIAAEFRQKIVPVQQAIEVYHAAVREVKKAEAEIEIAQSNVIRQYEANYLEARRYLGKELVEKFFPKIQANEKNSDVESKLLPAQTA